MAKVVFLRKQRTNGLLIVIASVLMLSLAVLTSLVGKTKAAESKAVHHSFSYDRAGDYKNVEILDYRYGDSAVYVTRPDPAWLAAGHIVQSGRVTGTFPVGNTLYVKWQVISTRTVYHKTVDLKAILPEHIEGRQIRFTVDGANLYIYLILREAHAETAPDCPDELSRLQKCLLVYPKRWANF